MPYYCTVYLKLNKNKERKGINIWKKSLPDSRSLDFLTFSLLEVYAFAFRFMIHFESIFFFFGRYKVCVYVYVCIFTYRYSIFPAFYFKKTILSPLNCLPFFKDQLSIFVWVCLWARYSILMIYVFFSITNIMLSSLL